MKVSSNAKRTLICAALVVVTAGGVLQFQKYLSLDPNNLRASAASGVSSNVVPIINEGDGSSPQPDAATGNNAQVPLPGAAVLQVGFSPGAGGLRVVLNMINGAEREVRLAAYSFTSPDVVRALVAAERRGVDVKVVVDQKGNATNSSSRQALNLLVNSRIPVRLNGKFAIHHDKYVIVDRAHVQTGSFNYSRSADSRNSENVLAIWNVPELAAKYLNHWESRYAAGVNWKSDY